MPKILVGFLVAGAIIVSLLGIFFNRSTNTNNLPSASSSVSSTSYQSSTSVSTTPVKPVSACKILTLDEIKTVYPGLEFKIISDRNDTPTVYEALSGCDLQSTNGNPLDHYYIMFTVRAQDSARSAERMMGLLGDKAQSATEFAPNAQYAERPNTSGGPALEWTVGNVYYQLTVQSFKQGAFSTIRWEVFALAKLAIN